MSAASKRLVWALQGLGLAIIAASLAAPLFREEMAWGLWPAVYLPAGWRWLLAMAAAGLVLWGDRLPCKWLDPLQSRNPVDKPHPVPEGVIKLRWPALRLALALLSALPFYLFRINHLRWGDAYILVHAIPHPEVKLTYTWQAPLDVLLHARLWALGNRLFGWLDPTPTYTLLSVAAGVVFIWLLLGLAQWLGRDRTERLLLIGLIASLGLMQLFFGYIENYTLMTVGVMAYIWLALCAMRGQVTLVWPASALALTHAFHPSTIVLAPSLLYVAWSRPSPGLPRCGRGGVSFGGRGVRFLQIAIPYLLVFAGVVALMTAGGHGLSTLLGPNATDAPGGGDHRLFVPLFSTSTRWEHYTMFSLAHLLDIVNEQLLVAPVIWPGLALTLIFAWRRLPRRDHAFRLLLVMAFSYGLLTLVWNADYGGQRDWDLFAPASLPAALLFGYALIHALPERAAQAAAGWALIAAQAFHTVLWIYQNTLPWSWK